jgi:hypothetical protein
MPVMLSRLSIVLALVVIAFSGCADAERIEPSAAGAVTHTASFAGYVYDGVSGARLPGYGMQIVVTTAAPTAVTVDAEGRYESGAISAWDDYTVVITLDGYRPFRSHNARVGLPPELAQSDDIADIPTHQTLFFDAYLFPTSLEAPAVDFTVTTPVEGEMVSGTMRLRPASPSSLSDEALETPGGVDGQVWSNDEDLQNDTVTRDLTNGLLSLEAGTLVYGVNYLVDIYDVDNYQPFEGTYTAGIEKDKTFQLAPTLVSPLQVVVPPGDCNPPGSVMATSGAVVTIVFNDDIQLTSPNVADEALDDGLSISSPDSDSDMMQNTLKPDASESTSEHGTQIMVSAGSTLELSWSPADGLLTSDPDDAIVSVTYSNLQNILVQRANLPASATPLAALIGTGAITCD